MLGGDFSQRDVGFTELRKQPKESAIDFLSLIICSRALGNSRRIRLIAAVLAAPGSPDTPPPRRC
jgi:hypothetical protein